MIIIQLFAIVYKWFISYEWGFHEDWNRKSAIIYGTYVLLLFNAIVSNQSASIENRKQQFKVSEKCKQ